MKKIVLTLAALSAISTSSLASGNRSWELRDTEYYTSSGTSPTGNPSFGTDSAALAVVGAIGDHTLRPNAFSRQTQISIENDRESRH